MAQEELEEADNITFLHQDALKNKNQFDSRVLSTIQEVMDSYPGAIFKLAKQPPW